MSVSPENSFYLTPEIIAEIHAEAIAQFDGSGALDRDEATRSLRKLLRC